MKSSVAISIVIPAFNEEKLIARCLISLQKQQFHKACEIIVVDNNSTDKTEEIARSFSVRVVREKNQGVVFARQKGLETAKGTIVVGADSDCMYPPHWLAHIYKAFEKNRNIVGCGGPAIAEKTPYWTYIIYKLGFGIVQYVYQFTGYLIYLGAFNLAFHRETFVKLGGYHTYLDFGGDEWDVVARLRKTGTIVFIPKAYMYISNRRYKVGFFKWLLVHAFYYYTLNYLLAKIFKRTLIHAQPVRNL